MAFGLVGRTPLILGGLADSCEFGLTKARPQDAARRLNLKESKGITNPDLNAMPTQRCQLVFSSRLQSPEERKSDGYPRTLRREGAGIGGLLPLDEIKLVKQAGIPKPDP